MIFYLHVHIAVLISTVDAADCWAEKRYLGWTQLYQSMLLDALLMSYLLLASLHHVAKFVSQLRLGIKEVYRHVH